MPTNAVQNGTEDRSAPNAVGYSYNQGASSYVCSGSLVAPTIVLTAGHCVISTLGVRSSDYIFSKPGEPLDAPIDLNSPPAKVVKVITVDGFLPTGGNEVNDIAFLILDKAIKSSAYAQIASNNLVGSLGKTSKLTLFGYGYVPEQNATYSNYPRKFELSWGNQIIEGGSSAGKSILIGSEQSAACIGDSGGPVVATFNGMEKQVGVLSGIIADAGEPCAKRQKDGSYFQHVTLIQPYLYLIAPYLTLEKTPTTTPTPSQSPSSAPVIPVSTSATPKSSISTRTGIKVITCFKGKTIKKVSGVKPACPKGYTKL